MRDQSYDVIKDGLVPFVKRKIRRLKAYRRLMYSKKTQKLRLDFLEKHGIDLRGSKMPPVRPPAPPMPPPGDIMERSKWLVDQARVLGKVEVPKEARSAVSKGNKEFLEKWFKEQEDILERRIKRMEELIKQRARGIKGTSDSGPG